MFSLFNNLRNSHQRFVSTRRSRRQDRARGSLRVEALEERRVLSATVHSQASAAHLNPHVSAAVHTAPTAGHHASQTSAKGGGKGATSGHIELAHGPAISQTQPVAIKGDAPSVTSNTSRSNTAAIDSCFANGTDLLNATSAATGDFSHTPIPAGFFEPGSAPFNGPIKLGGGSSGASDTIIQRQNVLVLPPDGPQKTVPIEIVSLSLVSCAPISVTNVTQPQHNGGTFDSTLLVSPKFTFQPLAPNALPPVPLSGSNLQLSFDPNSGFRGGVTVATGDVNGDGFADIIVGVGTGTGTNLNGFNNSSVFPPRSVFTYLLPYIEQDNLYRSALAVQFSGAANVAVNTQTDLSDGGRRRIEELLHDIRTLQKDKDDLGFFSDPLGGKRQSDQDAIDRKLAEIDDILNGR